MYDIQCGNYDIQQKYHLVPEHDGKWHIHNMYACVPDSLNPFPRNSKALTSYRSYNKEHVKLKYPLGSNEFATPGTARCAIDANIF